MEWEEAGLPHPCFNRSCPNQDEGRPPRAAPQIHEYCKGIEARRLCRRDSRVGVRSHSDEIEGMVANGYFLVPKMASLAAFATRNFNTFFAGILICSPVCGLRPILAFR